MKLRRLQIAAYKNVRACEIEFSQTPWIHAIIGSNGSGKSNLIEAILHILIGFYFGKAPRFDFTLEFEAHDQAVKLQREDGRVSVAVDGQPMSLAHFARCLRDPAQVFYPEVTLVYYSGECKRVERLIRSYRRHFQKLTRKPETDRYRPLIIFSGNEQSEVILLALFAHGHRTLLDRLRLEEILDVRIVLRSPEGFDPERHEPKLWNTEGAIRRIVAALDETATSQERPETMVLVDERAGIYVSRKRRAFVEERVYRFEDEGRGLPQLAQRLERGGGNVYQALESLRSRGMLRSVSFRLKGRGAVETFSFEHLSLKQAKVA